MPEKLKKLCKQFYATNDFVLDNSKEDNEEYVDITQSINYKNANLIYLNGYIKKIRNFLIHK